MGDVETFWIDAVSCSSAVTVVVCGDIDLATAPEVDEHLQAVERSSRDVVVDLTEVDFLDAAALRVLIASHRRLQAVGRRLAVRNASGIPQRVLGLAGLADMLEMAS